MAEEKQGWTRFFKKKDLAGEDFFGKVLAGLARVFEGGDEQETYRSIRTEMKAIFSCDDISLFAFDPAVTPQADEGDWVLTVKAGFGEGNRVSQAEAKSCPELAIGRAAPFTDELAQQAALKAVALAFEDNAFYGCDIEKSKVLLLKDPRPEDDLGSGDLSVLAIPLRYTQKVGKVAEQTKVGVLALFKTPNRRELGDLEKGLRSLLAHALVTPACTLRDPVTGLFTETHLKDELARYLNMFEMTGGQLNGGLIVGMVDCLKLYRTTLESAGKVDPAAIGTQISEALRGVAGCVWRRATSHQLGPNEELKCGIAGRFGHQGFAVILPLVKPFEMSMFSTRLSQDVVKVRFEAEQHLPGGQLTVSQRLIPFGPSTSDPAAVWKLAKKTIEDLEADQARARRDQGGLKEVVKSVKIFDRGNWVPPSEFKGDQPTS